jgi:hypothetical protein
METKRSHTRRIWLSIVIVSAALLLGWVMRGWVMRARYFREVEVCGIGAISAGQWMVRVVDSKGQPVKATLVPIKNGQPQFPSYAFNIFERSPAIETGDDGTVILYRVDPMRGGAGLHESPWMADHVRFIAPGFLHKDVPVLEIDSSGADDIMVVLARGESSSRCYPETCEVTIENIISETDRPWGCPRILYECTVTDPLHSELRQDEMITLAAVTRRGAPGQFLHDAIQGPLNKGETYRVAGVDITNLDLPNTYCAFELLSAEPVEPLSTE